MFEENYLMAKAKNEKVAFYDCEKCPAFCCSFYPRVLVGDDDVTRLAKHYNLTFEEAEKRFTKIVDGERLLRRRKDHLLNETCKFLDPKTRGCTIYHARPEVCRIFPDKPRCPYYDLWQFEQEQQVGRGLVIPLVTMRFPDEE
jgi:uncharacterized protein